MVRVNIINPNKLADQHLIAEYNEILMLLGYVRKYPKEDGTFGFEVKGDDVHLANDLLIGAYENLYDTAILVSGDEDFIPVINTLKNLDKKTENAFFMNTSSKKLRKICDKAVNLRNIIDKIRRVK